MPTAAQTPVDPPTVPASQPAIVMVSLTPVDICQIQIGLAIATAPQTPAPTLPPIATAAAQTTPTVPLTVTRPATLLLALPTLASRTVAPT